MKQIRKIVFLLIMLFAFSLNINAKTVCEYGDKLTITFSGNSVSINQDFYPNKFENDHKWLYDTFVSNNSMNTTNALNKDLYVIEGFCPSSVYYCKYEELQIGIHPANNIKDTIDVIKNKGSFKEIMFEIIDVVQEKNNVYIGETETALLDKYLDLKNAKNGVTESGISMWLDIKNLFDNEQLTAGDRAEQIGIILGNWTLSGGPLSIANYKSTYKECGTLEYKGELPTYNLACPKVSDYLKEYSIATTNYKNAKGNDKLDKLAIVKEKENQYREYCKTLLQNYDYEGLEGECIDSCLNIEETIHTFKEKNGLLNTSNTECGFSKRLLSFAANVMKWAKFILPVIVIVLGILDFIKAIGAEKDDDIKKAQKKFIYRLIAAALIFIVPFILEFVLDKLGFSDYTSGCGVITEIE